jgi:hypothetical protein
MAQIHSPTSPATFGPRKRRMLRATFLALGLAAVFLFGVGAITSVFRPAPSVETTSGQVVDGWMSRYGGAAATTQTGDVVDGWMARYGASSATEVVDGWMSRYGAADD